MIRPMTDRKADATRKRDALNDLMEHDWLGLGGTRNAANYRERDRLNREILKEDEDDSED